MEPMGKSGISNVRVDPLRPPTAEEMARDEATREPRTMAIGSTPEGSRNPLWSAAEFNGTWSCYCFPICCATVKQTNNGDDVVRMDAIICCVLAASNEYARIGNTNRFWSTWYDGGGGRSQEVIHFTSTTSVSREQFPVSLLACQWKTAEAYDSSC